MAKQSVGVPPFTAWAVLLNERVVGGDLRCAIFWTRTGAKAWIAHHPMHAYRIVRVLVDFA